jgi:Transposase DDE domain
VPVVPSSLLEPAWVEFCALIGGDRREFHPAHPLGCHRRRVPGRVVFEHVVAALVHGSGYERIATPGCSDRTIRRRLAEWAQMGAAEALHAAALHAYDQIIGLELGNVAVDGCMTKAPCGGERAGPSPVDRRKGGLKRSVATDGYGIPLGIACAGANRHDSPLLAPTLAAAISQLSGTLPGQRICHLDAGYDSWPTRQLLTQLGFTPQIARPGIPAPIQAGRRWPVERTHSWMNGYGKLRRMTDRNAKIVEFYLYLAAALVVIRQIIQRARNRYRWDTRPVTKRLV